MRYWLGDSGDVWFQNSGQHTMRVQVREDGVEIDQIVLSPVTYATNPPGPVSNDNTIVPKAAQAPGIPGTPNPASGATGVSINPTLTWTAQDATSYDVAFGASNPPPVVVSGQASASDTPPALNNNTQYFWRITARNGSGSTTGPAWSFTTSVAPPATPNSPSPADTAAGVPTNVTLAWAASGATSFDVLFGPTDPPSQVATGLSAASFAPGALAANTTYFWQIVAHNASGAVQGPEWTFTTVAPTPPSAPGSPSPANSATGVGTPPTLTWSAANATAYDVKFGTVNPPPQVATDQSAASYAPGPLANGTTYFWQIVAKNGNGTAPGPVWTFSTAVAAANVVIYASDIPAANLHGSWSAAPDASSPNSSKLVTTDTGYASTDAPPAAPIHYVDATFDAPAGTPYRLWLRMQALNNSKFNDSLWVQFSDAQANGASVFPIGSTSALDVNLAGDSTGAGLNGWGWQNGAYWFAQPTTFTFASSGTHTIRIQVREDGVQLDQIVLSPSQFMTSAPGPLANDNTIVSKPTPQTPPATPSAPNPADAATAVSTVPTLTWTASGAATYDVFFGTVNPPPFWIGNKTNASFTPACECGEGVPQPLTHNTTYFWKIVARNAAGTTTGPVWSFTTVGDVPQGLSSPSPADGATGVATNATLTWSAPGATSYDISFGTTNPPPQVTSGSATALYTPPTMATSTVYFWQVVARNSDGTTTGPVWSFTTWSQPPPSAPGGPSPADGATGVSTTPTLTWSAADATSYDVNIGQTNPPPQKASGLTSASYSPSGLVTGTTYFWQVVARNAGGTTTGPVWSFTTLDGPPSPPQNPSPANGATGVSSPTVSLLWSSATGAPNYDVFLGTSNPPPQVGTSSNGNQWIATNLAAGTTYFWQIVSRNSSGSTAGPVWSFTTAAEAPPPPTAPSSPSPADAATGVSTTPTLTWSAGGATSYDVKFGTTNPPATASTAQSAASYTPAGLTNSTTYYWQIVAINASGTTTGPVWSFTTGAVPNIVIYAGDVPAAGLHGAWTTASDATAANGLKLITTDAGFAATNNALASPTHFVDVTFNAPANTPYAIWLRLQALNNSKFNDSLWVQFSNAVANGSPIYPVGSTSALDVNLATDADATSLNGWGWQNGAYWLSQATTVSFATSGTHTMRIQVREDGAQLDQIVLSPSQYPERGARSGHQRFDHRGETVRATDATLD